VSERRKEGDGVEFDLSIEKVEYGGYLEK